MSSLSGLAQRNFQQMNESIADAWSSYSPFHFCIEHPPNTHTHSLLLCRHNFFSSFAQIWNEWTVYSYVLLMTVCSSVCRHVKHVFCCCSMGESFYIKRCSTHTLAGIKQLIKHLSVSNQWWINFKWIAMQVATNANEFKFSHLSIASNDERRKSE